MEKITSTRVNAKLGEVLMEASRGKAFVVTLHGRPYALISPVPDGIDLDAVPESPIGKPAA